MVKNILESGGGGGLGSRVVILRKQDDAYICNDEWKYLKGSFYNAESLYLSVIEDNSNINVVVLEGKIKDDVVSFMGYYTDEANNNHVFILTEGDVRNTVKVEYSIILNDDGSKPECLSINQLRLEILKSETTFDSSSPNEILFSTTAQEKVNGLFTTLRQQYEKIMNIKMLVYLSTGNPIIVNCCYLLETLLNAENIQGIVSNNFTTLDLTYFHIEATRLDTTSNTIFIGAYDYLSKIEIIVSIAK